MYRPFRLGLVIVFIVWLPTFYLLLKKKFIYSFILAALGLSCGTRDLRCGTRDLF